MACEKHDWFFDIPCPKCEADPSDPLKVPTFLKRGLNPDLMMGSPALDTDVRVWRHDSMRHIMVPKDAKAGDEGEWAGVKYKLVLQDGSLRYHDR